MRSYDYNDNHERHLHAAQGMCAQAVCDAAAPVDGIAAARRQHDAARNRYASSAAAVRKAREVLTHLEHDAHITEHEFRQANEALLRALRSGT